MQYVSALSSIQPEPSLPATCLSQLDRRIQNAWNAVRARPVQFALGAVSSALSFTATQELGYFVAPLLNGMGNIADLSHGVRHALDSSGPLILGIMSSALGFGAPSITPLLAANLIGAGVAPFLNGYANVASNGYAEGHGLLSWPFALGFASSALGYATNFIDPLGARVTAYALSTLLNAAGNVVDANDTPVVELPGIALDV